jgi:hypothetical protein
MSLRPKLLLAFALMLLIHPLHAGILVNGSFEAATNAATLDYLSLSPGATNIPGWTTTNAELTWDGPLLTNSISPALTAAQGYDFLDLTGTHDAFPYGAVFQTMTTTTGQQYQVSFELGSDRYWDSYYSSSFTAPIVAVSLNGTVVYSATNNFPTLNNYWQTWSFSFTASASNTTLMFKGANTTRIAYIGLDNVIVSSGPLVIVLSAPVVAGGQAQMPFTLTSGTPSAFQLLQSAQVNGPWVTNSSAVLATNVPGVTYTFTVPTAGADEFYRVLSP